MNIYYVYLHICPKTKEVVYVGKGCGGRAWDVSRNRALHKEHVNWLSSLQEEGYIASDWVTIIEKTLTEKAAFSKEKEYLHTKGTLRFNRQSGERNHKAKLTDEQVIEIYKKTKLKNKTHIQLAKEYKVSRATISMIASKKQWRATLAKTIL